MTDQGDLVPPSRRDRIRERATHAAETAKADLEDRRARQVPVDVLATFFERDRDTFASVLGSAIALRLFLFTVSLSVVVISTADLLFGKDGIGKLFGAAGVTGSVASQVESAAASNTGRTIWFLISGLVLTATSGRSLTRVLAACSAGAWRIGGREVKAPVKMMVRITLLSAAIIVAASILNRLRFSGGVAVATGSFAINIAILGIGWFLLSLSLPRRTRDPGAVLPGAVLIGVAASLLQWFMNYWFPRQIENASQVMGSVGVTVATLGYLFLIGRLMAASLVINAVLFERFGSVSEFVFGLPLVRRLPVRFPKLQRFFDLGPRDPAGPEGQEPDS